MRRISLLAVILLGLFCSLAAQAQDAARVAVRGEKKADFIRLVFSGAGLPKATVTEAGDTTLKIQFDGPVSVEGAGALRGVIPATTITAEGANAYVVKTGAMARHRTLTLGNRLFVDLYPKDPVPQVLSAVPQAAPKKEDSAKTPSVPARLTEESPAAGTPDAAPKDAVAAAIAAAKAAAAKVTAPESVPEKTVSPVAAADEAKAKVQEKIAPAKTTETSTSLVTENAANANPVDPKKETPALPASTSTAPSLDTPAGVMAAATPAGPDAPINLTPAATTPVPFTGSALITVGSTQGLALAAFVRGGYLWMVLSQEELSVPPQVSGPDAKALGPVDKVSVDGGSAYRIRLPAGAYVRPEGAGLVWRLYITGQKSDLKSASMERDFADTAAGPIVHIPMTNAVGALRLPDPLIGDDLAVITVGRADSRLINTDSYVDFETIPAIVGVVIKPKADGIRISVLPTEVVIARQGGLRLSATGPRPAAGARVAAASTDDKPADTKENAPTTIFAFKDWALGGPKQFLDMRHSIDAKIATAPDNRKLPEIISGAKFMLAQGLPHEATGFLSMALSFMPDLRSSPDFQAISGAVAALKGETDDAARAFATPGLETLNEIALWKSFNLAQAGQLPEAQKAMPVNAIKILSTYPARLQTLVLPPLIEAVLARGDVNVADTMLDMFDKASGESLTLDRDTALAFYRGRIAALRGDMTGASEFYRESSEGLDGPYPLRSTLALVERGLSARTIARDDAVRKLERFRYGWRGDDLESQTLERLGLIYVTGGQQRRGLTILRDAAAMTQDAGTREKLVAVMQKAFRELFSGKTREAMSPIEAAAVAAEFNELMPAGADGEQITLAIADKMVQVDLLERAADLIEPMVVTTATPQDSVRYAQRAAAIRILNDQPNDALKIIDKALNRTDVAGKVADVDAKRFALLRAKAKGQLKRADDALAELSALQEDSETLKLTADIAWASQKWPVAADAFGKLVKAANLSATRAPTHEQAQLVLNQALALNLSGETQKLEDLRVAYSDIMRRSDLNQPFQLVTRTAQEATLADRETLLQLVSEVNMFQDVLKAYQAPAKAVAEKPAAAKDAAPKPEPAKTEPAKVEPKAGEVGDAPAVPAADAPAGAQAPNEPGQAAEAARQATKE